MDVIQVDSIAPQPRAALKRNFDFEHRQFIQDFSSDAGEKRNVPQFVTESQGLSEEPAV